MAANRNEVEIVISAVDQASRMLDDVRRQIDHIGQAANEAERQTKSFAQNMDRIGGRMQGIGTRMTIGITTPLAIMGAAILNTAGQFEESMNQVQAFTNATGTEFEALEAQAKDLGATTRFSASEAADGMSFLASAGFNTTEIMAALPDVLQLAVAGSLDLATAADLASNVLTGFGLEASDLARVNDTLASAAAQTNTTVRQLGAAMSYVAPIAAAMGISVEDSAAAIGVLSNAGIQGERAGTAFRGMLAQLDAKAGELGISLRDAAGNAVPFADVLAQMEARGITAADAISIVGTEAGPGLAAMLSQGSQAFRDLTADIDDSDGAANKMADTMDRGFRPAMKQVGSAFEAVNLAIANTGLLDFATNIALRVADMMRAIANLNPIVLRFGVVIAGIAAAAGPTLIALGTFLKLLPAIKVAIITARVAMITMLGPIALIGLAIGALYVAWNQNWGGIQEITATAVAWIKEKVSGLITIGGAVIANWDKVSWAWGEILRGMSEIAFGIGDVIKGAFEVTVAAVIGAFDVMGVTIRRVFSQALNGIIGGLNAFVTAAGTVLAPLGVELEHIATVSLEPWEEIGARITDRIGTAMETVRDGSARVTAAHDDMIYAVASTYVTIEDSMNAIDTAVENVDTQTVDTGNTVQDVFGNLIPTAAGIAGEAMDGMAAKVTGVQVAASTLRAELEAIGALDLSDLIRQDTAGRRTTSRTNILQGGRDRAAAGEIAERRGAALIPNATAAGALIADSLASATVRGIMEHQRAVDAVQVPHAEAAGARIMDSLAAATVRGLQDTQRAETRIGREAERTARVAADRMRVSSDEAAMRLEAQAALELGAALERVGVSALQLTDVLAGTNAEAHEAAVRTNALKQAWENAYTVGKNLRSAITGFEWGRLQMVAANSAATEFSGTLEQLNQAGRDASQTQADYAASVENANEAAMSFSDTLVSQTARMDIATDAARNNGDAAKEAARATTDFKDAAASITGILGGPLGQIADSVFGAIGAGLDAGITKGLDFGGVMSAVGGALQNTGSIGLDALGGIITSMGKLASGDIVGAVTSAIGTIASAIMSIVNATGQWNAQLTDIANGFEYLGEAAIEGIARASKAVEQHRFLWFTWESVNEEAAQAGWQMANSFGAAAAEALKAGTLEEFRVEFAQRLRGIIVDAVIKAAIMGAGMQTALENLTNMVVDALADGVIKPMEMAAITAATDTAIAVGEATWRAVKPVLDHFNSEVDKVEARANRTAQRTATYQGEDTTAKITQAEKDLARLRASLPAAKAMGAFAPVSPRVIELQIMQMEAYLANQRQALANEQAANRPTSRGGSGGGSTYTPTRYTPSEYTPPTYEPYEPPDRTATAPREILGSMPPAAQFAVVAPLIQAAQTLAASALIIKESMAGRQDANDPGSLVGSMNRLTGVMERIADNGIPIKLGIQNMFGRTTAYRR